MQPQPRARAPRERERPGQRLRPGSFRGHGLLCHGDDAGCAGQDRPPSRLWS